MVYICSIENERITNSLKLRSRRQLNNTAKIIMKTYKVTYTKRIGGNGTILVKAENEIQALKNAKNLCATGSEFRDAVITQEAYSKPRKQGFQGYN